MRKYLLSGKLAIWIKTFLVKLKNAKKSVKFGRGCNVGYSAAFEGHNVIADEVSFSGKLGYGSYIGKKSSLSAQIGRYTCIGPNVSTIYGKHPIDGWVSVHPAFYSTAGQAGFSYVSETKFQENSAEVVIGNDVWIGANALIMGGVHIADGAVVAMGAVVTTDVAPYTIVGGVPAKVIKRRFSEEVAEKLEEIQWWKWKEEDIKERVDDFEDMNQFVKKYAVRRANDE